MARIGSKGAEYHPLATAVTEFTPRRAGQLFLFVNDAVGPWPLWQAFYGNNAVNARGETGSAARVTVTRLATSRAPATVR